MRPPDYLEDLEVQLFLLFLGIPVDPVGLLYLSYLGIPVGPVGPVGQSRLDDLVDLVGRQL